MKYVCSWCKSDLGEINTGRGNAAITHGICNKCVDALLSRNSKPLHEFLDSLNIPVIMIESGAIVRASGVVLPLLTAVISKLRNSRGLQAVCQKGKIGEKCVIRMQS